MVSPASKILLPFASLKISMTDPPVGHCAEVAATTVIADATVGTVTAEPSGVPVVVAPVVVLGFEALLPQPESAISTIKQMVCNILEFFMEESFLCVRTR